MHPLTTDIGKIYCKWNEEIDDFIKMRLVNIVPVKDSLEYEYVFRDIINDSYYRLSDEEKIMSSEQYSDIKKDWVLLKSSGIVSINNIVAVENEYRQIKDVLAIFFPNNKVTGSPEANQPFVVARQGIDNVFDPDGDTVGVSVSIDTLPNDYTLSDFMENASVLSSKLCHVYRTDTAYDLGILLNNDESNTILKDLYDHQYQYMKNTIQGFEDKINSGEISKSCLNGYNIKIEDFLKNSGFVNDVFHILGIVTVDFPIEAGKQVPDKDKLFLSILYGGIKIDKAIPLLFDYDIDLSQIKMKYMFVKDSSNKLWIIPYTEYPKDAELPDMYHLTDDITSQIQKRINACI